MEPTTKSSISATYHWFGSRILRFSHNHKSRCNIIKSNLIFRAFYRFRRNIQRAKLLGRHLLLINDHNAELTEIGIKPIVKGTSVKDKYPYVLFCAPPSRSADYAGKLHLTGVAKVLFFFTSSSASYDCNNNGFCNEDSPVDRLCFLCCSTPPCPLAITGKYCHLVERLQRKSSQHCYKVSQIDFNRRILP